MKPARKSTPCRTASTVFRVLPYPHSCLSPRELQLLGSLLICWVSACASISRARSFPTLNSQRPLLYRVATNPHPFWFPDRLTRMPLLAPTAAPASHGWSAPSRGYTMAMAPIPAERNAEPRPIESPFCRQSADSANPSIRLRHAAWTR
jgi:hypothetical protein